MIVVKDVVGFIKKPDDFVLQNPKKAALYSIAFKIIGFASLIISSCNPIAFVISSLCFLTVSIYIDHKILKNIEPIVFDLLEKWINHDPEKTGVFIGRVLDMVWRADPLSRARGIYRGFFFQRHS
ncbi:MAG: hypothetical protein KR126chlam4_00841 [Candidatus Anoxychlamydiales bacterium]|nr:hypothetical protein [Candidatus Anoxychlamydiales bacterium]HEU64695.1 hypothetical protein [Chlamydiota bacterium]